MEFWLNAARAAAGVNVLLLLALGSVWLRGYRSHGASHTLGLLVFAALLLIQNLLWLYFYLLHPKFIDWFLVTSTDVQIGVTLLCALELVALAFLSWITFR